MNEPRLMFRQLASRLAGGLARQFGQFPSGVCGIASPESGPVVEFVVLGSRRPAHSGVELRMVPAHPGTLVAELEQHGRVRASCTSLGSIQFRGRFRPGTHVRLAADRAVQVLARTEHGDLLAGPIELRPEHPWATLRW